MSERSGLREREAPQSFGLPWLTASGPADFPSPLPPPPPPLIRRISTYVQSRSSEMAAYLQKQIPNLDRQQQKSGPGSFTFISPRDAKEAAANAFAQKND